MKISGKHSITVLAAVLTTAALGTGCGRMNYLTHARDRSDMVAVPAMRSAQTLNPEAGRNRRVVTGLDSQIAKNINEGYGKSFIKQEATQRSANSLFLGLQGISND